MRISFLIPSYNHCNYIGFTLDSIFSDADSLDYEIIVIDDGSTDESRLIIDAWCKLHPLVDIRVTYRENRGLCVTLNELVRQATGEIIRLCASDDGVYAGSSLKIIDIFASSDCAVLVGDAWVIDGSGKIIGKSAIELNGGRRAKMKTSAGLKQEIISNWSIPGPCFALRRRVYDKVGYYSEDLLIEDWDFFLRVAALCSIKFIDEYFSYYRLHDANTSKTINLAKRIINISSQLLAGKRRLNLFNGRLRALLEVECFLLRLKLIYLRLATLLIASK